MLSVPFLFLIFTSVTLAEVKITNYSGRSAYVAQQTYNRYSSSTSAGLAVITPAGWTFGGWYEIGPGDTFRTSNNRWLYVKGSNGVITWGNQETSSGFVLPGSRFSGFLRKNDQSGDARKLRNKGYKSVTYRKFDKGRFNITGNAYVRRSKTFKFSYESRSIKFISKTFSVPGKVIDYDWSATTRYEKVSWRRSSNGRGVFMSGSIEGRQTSAFAAREKALYKGSVTVTYAERR